MGSGRWSADSFTAYATSTNYRSMSRDEVFSKSVQTELKSEAIKVRESRDSAESPNSTPIILALDVTGSMGEYAEKIAKDELPKLMNAILEQSPVADPHLMFMAIDDVHAYSHTPLQVSQFEADIRILEQLRKIVLVGGGGGNRSESYEVGEEVKQAFCDKYPELDTAFIAGQQQGKYFADLYAIARFILQQYAVTTVLGGDQCSYQQADDYYSYRRQAHTGRMATFVFMQA